MKDVNRKRREKKIKTEILESESSTRDLKNKDNKFDNCIDNPEKCGFDATCRKFDNNTSRCVCPNDMSAPTNDLKCPNRSIIPATPKAIPNVMLVPKNNDIEINKTSISTNDPLLESTHHTGGPEKFIALGCIILFMIVASSIIYFLRQHCYTKKAKRKSLALAPISLKESLLPIKYTSNTQYFGGTPLEIPIVRRENLTFLDVIGEGCFGKVYKGELNHGDSKEIIAVKVLKDLASSEAEEDFMREVETMSSFKHENILSLIGIVQHDTNTSPWMIFEYMLYGDLADVLRSNSQEFKNDIPGLAPLNRESLHYITIQIAAGMNYLSSQRFVHRDLACRNCLVGLDLVVKIADFGMSRDVYTSDYYKIGGSRMLPVRWMSPESVLYGRFTLESDVWSFGVVLWEIYSYGKQPYYGHNNEEVVKLILQGIMLIPPEDCPTFICQIMSDCWKSEARDRCKFSDILEKLENEKKFNDKCDIINLPRPPQGPISIRSPNGDLDTEGYLVPAVTQPREYLQPLPPSIYSSPYDV
ncbi:hypothetical protein HCN44_002587 [Aphidius gifuensis]|uniref:Protein kinase domain-containing protein n=1 Tax=Aphidius gifuensis TaxID=684658 RepID=A0A834Y1I1_APHGI|nr:hypothetical protein HCN44_002587 [Aphidius gifuensis]